MKPNTHLRTGRKGFTLVELLIVIIIIGILAGAMMMLMGTSSDRAEATKIISNLRSLKAAALQFHAGNPNDADITIDKLKPFMDGQVGDGYQAVRFPSADVIWYVFYGPPGTLLGNAGIRKALANSASDSSLLGQAAITAGGTTPLYAEADPVVGMKAR